MRGAASFRISGLALVLCLAAGVAWSADDDLKSALQGRYAAMKIAMRTHDRNALLAILSPDFTSVDVSGQAKTSDQMLADLAALPDDPNRTSQTTILSLAPEGDAVTVIQNYAMKTVKTDANGNHNVNLTATSTDVWVRSKDTWIIKRTQTDEISYAVDGRILMHRVKQ